MRDFGRHEAGDSTFGSNDVGEQARPVAVALSEQPAERPSQARLYLKLHVSRPCHATTLNKCDLVSIDTSLRCLRGENAETVEGLHMFQGRTLPEADQECSSSGEISGRLKVFLTFAFVVALLSLAFSLLGVPSTY